MFSAAGTCPFELTRGHPAGGVVEQVPGGAHPGKRVQNGFPEWLYQSPLPQAGLRALLALHAPQPLALFIFSGFAILCADISLWFLFTFP